jgi:hypothetical protein
LEPVEAGFVCVAPDFQSAGNEVQELNLSLFIFCNKNRSLFLFYRLFDIVLD